VSHQVFETTDEDRAAEYLTRAYGTRFRLTSGRNGYLYRHTRLVADRFSIDTSVVNRHTEYLIDSAPVLFVIRPSHAAMSYRSAYAEYRLGHNEVLLCNTSQDGAPFCTTLQDGAVDAAILPFSLLAEVAGDKDTARQEPIRFTDQLPVGRIHVRHLNTSIDFLAAALRDRPQVMSEPLVAGSAARMLAAAVLATFPNTAVTEPTIEDRRDSHPGTLRRAIAFVEGTADRDISVADIAAAANVTIRALQHTFRRHLGTTPMAYVRQVRLQQAHQELLAADPTTGATVTEIAARWGFYHPGRFAQYYRDTYGRTPHQTMLRDGPR
jgi:AraC-like DNA-binding protein